MSTKDSESAGGLFKDRIVTGALAGIIAALVKNIPSLIFYKTGIIKFTMIHIASSVMFKIPDVYTPLGYLTGTIGDLITGGLGGILIIFVLTWLGFDYWWYKGLILSSAIWFFGFGTLLNLGITHINPSDDPLFRFLALFDHWIYGLLASYLISRWYKRFKYKLV